MVLEGTQEQTYYAGSAALQHLTVKAGARALVDENLRYNESGLLETYEDLAGETAHRFIYDRFKRLKEKRRGTTATGSLLESFDYSKGGRLRQKNGASLSYTVNGQPGPWGDAVKRIGRAGDAVDYGYQASYGLMTSMRGSWQGKAAGLEISYDLDRQVRQVTWDTGVTRTLGLSPTGERAAMYETSGGLNSFVGYAGPHYERAETGNNVVHLFRFTDESGQAVLEERVEQQVFSDGTSTEQAVGWQQLARDYSGSVAAILPSGGEVTRRSYEAFGAPGARSGGTDLGYTGHRHLQLDGSPLGLIDMGGRMYDPLSGQFTRADPFMPNAGTPKGFNRRAYVQGDPINRIDPTGFRDDCNPATGACQGPAPWMFSASSGGSAPGLPNYGPDVRKFFKDILGITAIQNKREAERARRRYKAGFYQLQGGGSAPNTAGLQSQVASAVDQLGSEFRQDGARILRGFGDLVSFGSALGGAAAGAGQAMVVPDAGDAILATSGVGAALADGPLPFGDAYLASVAAYIGSSRLMRGALALGEGVARLGARGLSRVNGRLPINSRYAGDVMPASALARSIRGKYPHGVPFNVRGFPEFTRYERARVQIQLTGDRTADFAAANKAARFSRTPRNYTWHHHQDPGLMQLVPTDLHDAVRHTGGAATSGLPY